MLYHHELEKYTFFFSQIDDNRKGLTLPYQSGVSQFAFIYLQATDHPQEKKKKPKQNKTQKQNTATVIKKVTKC